MSAEAAMVGSAWEYTEKRNGTLVLTAAFSDVMATLKRALQLQPTHLLALHLMVSYAISLTVYIIYYMHRFSSPRLHYATTVMIKASIGMSGLFRKFWTLYLINLVDILVRTS